MKQSQRVSDCPTNSGAEEVKAFRNLYNTFEPCRHKKYIRIRFFSYRDVQGSRFLSVMRAAYFKLKVTFNQSHN